jgi:hypothetical protein
LTILGIQEPRKIGISLEKLKGTDFKIIYYLVKDPRARVEDMARYTKVTTKTVKRRLDNLITNNIIAFSTTFKPESIQGYILFHILLIGPSGSESKIFERLRCAHQTSSTEIEKSWLFIDKDIKIYQNWIIDEVHKIDLN